MTAIIEEIGKATVHLLKEPVSTKIQVAKSDGSTGAEDREIFFYYSNEATRVKESDSWALSKVKFTDKSNNKTYEVSIYKVDYPNPTKDEQGKKICRFHYKEVNSSSEKQLETKDITDCKGWIGLRDKEGVDKAKGAKP